MIPSMKNRQTMDILRKLRAQGAPSRDDEIGTVSLDMTLPPKKQLLAQKQEEAEMDEAEEGMVPPTPVSGTNLKPKKKRQ